MPSSLSSILRRHERPRKPLGPLLVRRLDAVSLLLALVVLGLGTYTLVAEPGPFLALRHGVFDAYQQQRPRATAVSPVRVVDVDEASLERLGQWPWPRTRIADLVERLHAMGAVVIALDVLFAEPDQTSPARLLEDHAYDERAKATLLSLPDHDEQLARAVSGAPVITGFVVDERPLDRPVPASKGRFVVLGDDPAPFLPGYPGAVPTLPLIEAAAAGNGALNFAPTGDGVVRKVPLILRMGAELYPSLVAEVLRLYTGAGHYVVRVSGASPEGRWAGRPGILSVGIGPYELRTDAQAELWVHYRALNRDRYLPAWKVLEGRPVAGALAGQIVFVGTSAKGLQDLRVSSLGEVIPGVEVHAQLTEQILLGASMVRPDWALSAKVLYLLAMGILIQALSLRRGALLVATFTVSGIALALSATWLLWTRHQLILDLVTPSLWVLVLFLVTSVPRQIAVEAQQRWIRGAFANYVSPNLVRYLVAHPGELSLGGERRECSFVLTDISGFTSLMEQSDPGALVSVINGYLDGMVRIAFAHDGTIDRIVGDAVAVMFSAPVVQPDHARRAVSCALAMDEFARRYALDRRARGIPFGDTRIGVHTGRVVVGNFGGSGYFDYRALGDPINTTARLENANRYLGTRICVSAATAEACPGFSGRPAGVLVLRGKAVAVLAYEPLPPERAASPSVAAYREAFEALDGDPVAARARFRALADEDPDDLLVRFHLTRLERGERGKKVALGNGS